MGDAKLENYMKLFETMAESTSQVADRFAELARQPDDQHRVAQLMKLADAQQKLNNDLYNTIVEMHNFYAEKLELTK